MTFSRNVAINILMGLAGAAVAGVLAFVAAYLSAAWINSPIISDVRAAAAVMTKGHERWLQVNYHVIAAHRCPSWTQHLLYHDVDVLGRQRTVVVALGIMVNVLVAPGGHRDFDINMILPRDLIAGKWQYVAVTSMTCEWMPGLAREQVQTTEPSEVMIPPA